VVVISACCELQYREMSHTEQLFSEAGAFETVADSASTHSAQFQNHFRDRRFDISGKRQSSSVNSLASGMQSDFQDLPE
jgi:hypothetical protein